MASRKQQKEQKRVQRRRRIDKERNMLHNLSGFRFQLHVLFEGKWRVVKRFRQWADVKEHVRETEEMRSRGDTTIIEGKVFDMRSGREVAHIEPFEPQLVGPGMAEAAITPKGSLVGINVEISEEKVSE